MQDDDARDWAEDPRRLRARGEALDEAVRVVTSIVADCAARFERAVVKSDDMQNARAGVLMGATECLLAIKRLRG